MNKNLTTVLVVIGGIVLSALVLGAGMFIVHGNWAGGSFGPAGMGWGSGGNNASFSMMGNGYGMAPGTGVGRSGMTLAPAPRAGVGGYQPGIASNVNPLSIDQAKKVVEGYLSGLNNSDLELKEIMIFNNNAYAIITEKSTGIGAMELLVDPVSLSVFPEYGPNMMWNLKYGHMGGMTLAPAPRAGVGGYSGMMGGYNNDTGSVSANMTVSPEQALQAAQQYLDQQFPGYKTADDADPFYGYYTIDILKDGQPTGMLSVNGFSGQVFLHTWHGTFIEMWE